MRVKSVALIMILTLISTTIPVFATSSKETTYGAKAGVQFCP